MPSSSYSQRVHRVMDYVRRHLSADLTLDELAKVAYFSPYHFHRIFKATAGETVAEFTRRARLERAAYLMKAAPSRKLGSIALEVGFGSQADFSRVFRQHYGIPPSAWDRRSRLDDRPPLALPAADPPIAARLVDHPPCRIAYVRLRSPFLRGTLGKGYDRLRQLLEARGVDWSERALSGLSWDHYDATPLDRIRFDLGFSVDDGFQPDDELGVHELPPLRAVDAHSHGPLSRIAQAWDYLYLEWLPSSRFEPDDMPGIKRFRQRPDEIGWQVWNVDCSIAVRPLRP